MRGVLKSATSVAGGAVVFVFTIILGLALSVTFGPVYDLYILECGKAGCFDVWGSVESWAHWDSSNDVLFFNNMGFSVFYLIPIFGFIYFLITIVIREPEDWEESQYYYE
jgi:hypothetical protein